MHQAKHVQCNARTLHTMQCTYITYHAMHVHYIPYQVMAVHHISALTHLNYNIFSGHLISQFRTRVYRTVISTPVGTSQETTRLYYDIRGHNTIVLQGVWLHPFSQLWQTNYIQLTGVHYVKYRAKGVVERII